MIFFFFFVYSAREINDCSKTFIVINNITTKGHRLLLKYVCGNDGGSYGARSFYTLSAMAWLAKGVREVCHVLRPNILSSPLWIQTVKNSDGF